MTSHTEKDIIQNTPTQDTKELANRTPFDVVLSMALKTVRSKSKRVYGQTYSAWQAWCNDNNVHPIVDLNMPNVETFLLDAHVTRNTRQRHLSALRKLAEIIAILDGDIAQKNYEFLKMMKVPEHDESTEAELSAKNERSRRALSPSEVDLVLRAFPGTDFTSRRNTALLATLFFTGMRRTELVNLQWRDVNFENATIEIRHGKGDKSRTVTIIGGERGFAVMALRAWQTAQAETAESSERLFIFCSARGGKLGDDTPTHADTVWRVVKNAAKIADIDEFSPHDARRTVITEWTQTGTLSGAQAQAGHKSEAMTLKYAIASNAVKRHDETSGFRYGAMTNQDRSLFAEIEDIDSDKWLCPKCGQTAMSAMFDGKPDKCPFCGDMVTWQAV